MIIHCITYVILWYFNEAPHCWHSKWEWCASGKFGIFHFFSMRLPVVRLQRKPSPAASLTAWIWASLDYLITAVCVKLQLLTTSFSFTILLTFVTALKQFWKAPAFGEMPETSNEQNVCLFRQEQEDKASKGTRYIINKLSDQLFWGIIDGRSIGESLNKSFIFVSQSENQITRGL